MLDLKDLHCLSALARHRHFARAAEECGISQPAFSMRIRKIEERLQTPIVKRGNRFQGLTDEGQMIVRHARRIMDEVKSLEQELKSAKGEITGSLVLGVIPTALAYAGRLLRVLNAQYPNVFVRIESATSLEIQQGIDDGTFDAGITYLDGAALDLMRVDALYDETYVLVAPTAIAPRTSGPVTWAEAADLPLCLLERGMQNRRILDQTFADAGVRPQVVAETSAFTTALVLAIEGGCATIVPDNLVEAFHGFHDTVALPLIQPVQEKTVCLMSAVREAGLPALAALRTVALM
ncbi:MAG: LysR family transcriptional regulator [Rhodobacteraceae bacterium]|nr:LysR family transcriptional regulator [Paracoccaceae bacterium]